MSYCRSSGSWSGAGVEELHMSNTPEQRLAADARYAWLLRDVVDETEHLHKAGSVTTEELKTIREWAARAEEDWSSAKHKWRTRK